ncbi:unnamed protein product, partial [Allacma fusca]
SPQGRQGDRVPERSEGFEMHFTQVLMKMAGGSGRRAQGFQWIGKHRLAHGIYPRSLESLAKRIRTEEQNLFYLRHPYLTVEQEDGHAKELKKFDKWLNNKRLENAVFRTRPSVRMEDKLGHLNVSSAWELD